MFPLQYLTLIYMVIPDFLIIEQTTFKNVDSWVKYLDTLHHSFIKPFWNQIQFSIEGKFRKQKNLGEHSWIFIFRVMHN